MICSDNYTCHHHALSGILDHAHHRGSSTQVAVATFTHYFTDHDSVTCIVTNSEWVAPGGQLWRRRAFEEDRHLKKTGIEEDGHLKKTGIWKRQAFEKDGHLKKTGIWRRRAFEEDQHLKKRSFKNIWWRHTEEKDYNNDRREEPCFPEALWVLSYVNWCHFKLPRFWKWSSIDLCLYRRLWLKTVFVLPASHTATPGDNRATI